MRAICILITATILTAGFLSCKKEKNNIDEDDVRIVAIESGAGLSSSPSMRISFEYDQLGRIESVNIKGDSIAPTTLYKINYLSNQIVMVGHSDTIQMILDANKNVSKRIWTIHEQNQLDPDNIFYRYAVNTTIAEYNDAGLLVKESIADWDTTWYNSGASTSYMGQYTGSVSYTNAGNDLMNRKEVSEINWSNHTVTGTIITKRSWEYNFSFGYAKAYENTTDFSNAAVLNQLTRYFWGYYVPLNKGYAHFPDQMSWSYIERDENGNTISSHNSTFNDEFTYNSYGFLLTRTDPNLPMGKVKFVYDR